MYVQQRVRVRAPPQSKETVLYDVYSYRNRDGGDRHRARLAPRASRLAPRASHLAPRT